MKRELSISEPALLSWQAAHRVYLLPLKPNTVSQNSRLFLLLEKKPRLLCCPLSSCWNVRILLRCCLASGTRQRERERKPSGTRNAIMHLIHIAIMSADLSPEFAPRHHQFTRTGGGFWFIYLDYFFLPAESRFDLTVIKIRHQIQSCRSHL